MIGSTSYDYERFISPLYSYAEADRLAEVPPNTARRWVKGYRYWNEWGERVAQPPVTTGRYAEPQNAVSFFDLIGIKAIDGLRQTGFGLPTIRKVVSYCQDELGVEYPLVTYRFKVDRRQIFVEEGEGQLLNVLGYRGMRAWEDILDPFLESVDYHHEFARRWWPRGRQLRVVVDPDYGFGLPVIADTSIRTEIIAERYKVGETLEEIAADFAVEVPQIKDALQYELPNAA